MDGYATWCFKSYCTLPIATFHRIAGCCWESLRWDPDAAAFGLSFLARKQLQCPAVPLSCSQSAQQSEAPGAQAAMAVPGEQNWNADSWAGWYLLWMGLRLIWPVEQASWPLSFQKVLCLKNPLVVHYKALTPMQTDHSTTLQKPGWPQSVQSNKRWKWERCGRILGLYQLLGKTRFLFHLMSRTRLSLLITAM